MHEGRNEVKRTLRLICKFRKALDERFDIGLGLLLIAEREGLDIDLAMLRLLGYTATQAITHSLEIERASIGFVFGHVSGTRSRLAILQSHLAHRCKLPLCLRGRRMRWHVFARAFR